MELLFAYHAHGYEFQPYENGTLLDYIIRIQILNMFRLKWISCGPILAEAILLRLLKKYGDRWKLMHLKDLKKGTKKDLTGVTSHENDVPSAPGNWIFPILLRKQRKLASNIISLKTKAAT